MNIPKDEDVGQVDDTPVVELPDSEKSWFNKISPTYYSFRIGQVDDTPAVELPDSEKSWYRNGHIHREDGEHDNKNI